MDNSENIKKLEKDINELEQNIKELEKDSEFEHVLAIYSIANEIQRYEGSGIWSRFNILISLHIVLFGIVAFLFSSNSPGASSLIVGLSLGGCLLSLWAVYVLQKLWLWHTHWKNTLSKIEEKFPASLPKLFSERPDELKKTGAWYQSWLTAYTQPFLFLLFTIWLSLALFMTVGNGITSSQSGSVLESESLPCCCQKPAAREPTETIESKAEKLKRNAEKGESFPADETTTMPDDIDSP